MAGLPGGLSKLQYDVKEMQQTCNQLRSDIEKKSGKEYSTFKVTSYRSQVVAGTMFYVNIEVDSGEYIHVKIFQNLPCNVANGEKEYDVLGVVSNKSPDDPISF